MVPSAASVISPIARSTRRLALSDMSRGATLGAMETIRLPWQVISETDRAARYRRPGKNVNGRVPAGFGGTGRHFQAALPFRGLRKSLSRIHFGRLLPAAAQGGTRERTM